MNCQLSNMERVDAMKWRKDKCGSNSIEVLKELYYVQEKNKTIGRKATYAEKEEAKKRVELKHNDVLIELFFEEEPGMYKSIRVSKRDYEAGMFNQYKTKEVQKDDDDGRTKK